MSQTPHCKPGSVRQHQAQRIVGGEYTSCIFVNYKKLQFGLFISWDDEMCSAYSQLHSL